MINSEANSVSQTELTLAFEAFLLNNTLLPFNFKKNQITSKMALVSCRASISNVKKLSSRKYNLLKHGIQNFNIPFEIISLILSSYCDLFSDKFLKNKLYLAALINHLEILEIIGSYIPSLNQLNEISVIKE